MNVYTETDKPIVTIVMAVYEPRLDWLREQLKSLNAQTQTRIELSILDDCSPNVPFNDIYALAAECITAFPYTIERNNTNLGSNGTFERLTEKAQGEYIAYCDQDDIWLPEKLEKLIAAIQADNAKLVCSDMLIIDENGNVTTDSITKTRRHHVFYSGEGLAPNLVFHNWVTGCTMLLHAKTAKEAMPFCPYMVHDHWLALFCAVQGKINCLPEPLIKYRVHNGNQTLQMAGVFDRESYITVRIERVIHKLEWLNEYMECNDSLKAIICDGLIWARAREANMRRCGGKLLVWKYRRFSLPVSLFEVFATAMPEQLFMHIVDYKRENRI